MSGLTARLREITEVWRNRGVRASFERGGWRLLAAVAAYYLVRDVVLYILVPLGVLQLIH